MIEVVTYHDVHIIHTVITKIVQALKYQITDVKKRRYFGMCAFLTRKWLQVCKDACLLATEKCKRPGYMARWDISLPCAAA